MNILVTGGLGFVGSHLIKFFKNKQEIKSIVNIDNMFNGLISNFDPEIENYFGDLSSEKLLNNIFSKHKIDYVFHMAGQSSGQVSFEDPLIDAQCNVMSTINLLEMCRKYDCKNFIYASSMSVYGDSSEYVDEKTRPKPKSFYGIGKLTSEKYLSLYSNYYNTNCVSLRFFNIYGPGQNLNNLKQGMISIYLKMALDNKHIKVKGSLDRFRDLIYIDDVINAIDLVYKNMTSGNKIYNVCTGKKTKISEILEIFQKIDPDITFEEISGTPGDQKGIYGDPSLINHSLKFKSKMSLLDGLKQTYIIEKNRNNFTS